MSEAHGNQRFTPEQVIAALEASGGIHLGAAAKLGCSPSTIRNYVDRYPEIKAACESTTEDLLDIAEDQLLKQIRNGNMTAVIFYLKTKGKQRGYVERTEVGGKDGKDLVPAGLVTIFQLPDNQRQPAAEPAPDGGAS